jgi:manganese transport protein
MLGPAGLVSVGYMDPGNFATDLEGGARFGYGLIWVLVMSNVMALLLQSASARLAIGSGLDLASACRTHYSRRVSAGLWILAELAIVACDLAEVLGSAVALNLLFSLPLVAGALLTSADALLILGLRRFGAGPLEALVLALLVTIAGCLGLELLWAKPDARLLAAGLVPHLNGESLYVAIGILGATVMPHNLYLQSGLVADSCRGMAPDQKRPTLRRSWWSTALALNLALALNGAILVLAAAVFWSHGLAVTDLRDAYALLLPSVGGGIASSLFAVGLLCSGQSATVTGTLAGQIVMEGFLELRLSPALRRFITRGLAVIPAVAVLSALGASGAMPLLIASQVVLSFQLPFAVAPLVRLTSSRPIMGDLANGRLGRAAATACGGLITLANLTLVARTAFDIWRYSPALAFLFAIAGAAGFCFLLWVCGVPLDSQPATVSRRRRVAATVHVEAQAHDQASLSSSQ